METIILQGDSKSNARLIPELARKLNFSAKKIKKAELEEIAIALSIDDGVQSGFLSDMEKDEFIDSL